MALKPSAAAAGLFTGADGTSQLLSPSLTIKNEKQKPRHRSIADSLANMGFTQLFRSTVIAAAAAVAVQPWLATAAVDVNASVSALTLEIESDWTAVYYSKTQPLLLGNDGSAATGGFRTWKLDSASPLAEVQAVTPGRTKLVTTVYDIQDKDYAVTIAQPDSIVRVYGLPDLKEVKSAQFKVLGDWSALCSWRSKSNNQYVYLFGKKQGVQLLVRKDKDDLEVVEIQSFEVPVEASGCAVSPSANKLYLSADDDKDVYVFDLVESTAAPKISKAGEAKDDVTGVAVYVSEGTSPDYLLVAQTDVVSVYASPFTLLGNIKLTGYEDIEVQGLNVYQAKTTKYPAGALTLAIEAEDVKAFGIASLDGALQKLGVKANAAYDPRTPLGCRKKSPVCGDCSGNGFCQRTERGQPAKCDCFAGWAGDSCKKFTCVDDCSGHGKCVGANMCKCDAGWGGLHCSFVLVEPAYETDANGGDGDDPAIWISPVARERSRIITTTKSADGAGLGLFDLTGKLLQTIPAGEPNNVDIIYGFQAGSRKVDLAFAACRKDDTLCLFEITPNGTLATISGGSQKVVPKFKVYGSCTYRSRKTGKQYLFVNAKTSQYLQYELTASANGTLATTLVRDFKAGSGGQVEGCVTDEDNGWIFIGEEPHALWRYDAEPDSKTPGVAVGTVGDGHLRADVEGVTLVVGDSPSKGFILVSTQGVSAYNVYRRAPPHAYVATFTITDSKDGKIDAVSNTDGITAVGTALGKDFPHGLFVTHDDANQLPGGKTSAEASFKLVSLEAILGAEPIKKLKLLDDVDKNWDPRK